MAKNFIQMTEHGVQPADRNTWIPLDEVSIGAVWRGSVSDWPITIGTFPGTMTISRWRQPSLIGNEVSDKTIVLLIQAFVTCQTHIRVVCPSTW
jgi:hypothetical protein